MTTGLKLLRQYIRRAGMNQREFARQMKRSEPTVSLWLSGQNTPDLESALALKALAGIPVEAWVKGRKRKAA